MAAQNLREAQYGAAPGQVGLLVVDGFESIHIQEHNAERPLRSARTIQLRFQHADETAVVGKAGERIADGHRTNLVEQARLIEQRSRKHHDVARSLAELREKERSIEKVPGKCRGDM